MPRSLLGCLGITALAALGCVGHLAYAGEHPDLSGVWGPYVEPGKPPAGRRGMQPELPFTAEGRKRVDAYRALIGDSGDNPGAHCLGYGMPQSMLFSGGYPMEIIQRPEQITVIYEAHAEIRRLYFKDKVIPEPDRLPGRNGYSVARWEGDALVVETGSLKEQEDQTYAHSDQAHILEKYQVATDARGARVLSVEMTLTDPVFYQKPVSVTKKWTFDPKGILLPYECNEEVWLDHLEELKKGKSPAKTY
jgi:hypothetical protein